MNKESVYQQLRGHLAYLKLPSAAEALPTHFEQAPTGDPSENWQTSPPAGGWKTSISPHNPASTKGWYGNLAEDAASLFQVISRRYQKGSIILTTNRPVASSGEILSDSTMPRPYSTGYSTKVRGFHHHRRQLPAQNLPSTSQKTPTTRKETGS